MIRSTVLISLVLILTACRFERAEQPQLIVCTTGIIADCVRQILPSSFEVKSLMGPGVDPHLYEAKPSDIKTLSEAELIVMNGFHLEGKLHKVFRKWSRSKSIVSVAEFFPIERRIQLTQNSTDPHIWFDLPGWVSAITALSTQLQKIFPDEASRIQLLTRNWVVEMSSIHQKLSSELNSVPPARRVLITSHDAFSYFGRTYNYEVLALQGVSTVAEPGLGQLAKLTKKVVDEKIPAIFVENSVSPKSIESLLSNCQQRGWKVRRGGTLYSDALGGKGSGAETYSKMLQKNVQQISNALK